MKISMYMIERWMKEYSPISIIINGKMDLEGVRMFSSTLPSDPRYIYVGRTADFLPEANSEEILLIHQNDVIHLLTEDLEDVFNHIESVFEYYQELEYELMLAIHLDHPEQRIIDLCQREFGPSYIMNQKYHILAISKPQIPGDYKKIWEELQKTRIVSLEALYDRNTVAFYQNINRKVHNLIFQNTQTAPYLQGVMNTYCSEEGNIIGQCMIAFDRRIETADLQLIDVIMQFMNSIKNKPQQDIGSHISEILLDTVINQHDLNSEDLLKIFSLQRWAADTQFCMIAFKTVVPKNASNNSQWNQLANLQYNLYRKYIQSVSILKEDHLICCFPVNSAAISKFPDYMQEQILNSMNPSYTAAGFSYIYKDFTKSFYYYKQARYALMHGIAHKQTCTSIFECALDTMIASADTEFKLASIHPLIPLLEAYDATNNTDYGKTLWLYLRNDNSYLEVAKELNVHRNTILYRIERILDLYPQLNVKNPYEKEYLLYSFRIHRISQKESFSRQTDKSVV